MLNSLGEKVKIYLDASEGRVVMDRAESGIVDFGKKVKPHDWIPKKVMLVIKRLR